jgi:hypothetical protein
VVFGLIEEVERLAIQVKQLEEDNARLEAELEVSRDLDRIGPTASKGPATSMAVRALPCERSGSRVDPASAAQAGD